MNGDASTAAPPLGMYPTCPTCPYNQHGVDAVHGARADGGEGGKAEWMPDEKLRPRQRLFIAHYLECLNATEAARRAGYKDGPWLRHFAQKLTTKVHIREAIREGLDAMTMSAAEILARIAAVARGNIGDFLEIDASGHARINVAKAKELGQLGLIKRLVVDANGRPEIELHNALDALAHLARVFSLFAGKQIHTPTVEDSERIVVQRAMMQNVMANPDLAELMIKMAERLGLPDVLSTPPIPPHDTYPTYSSKPTDEVRK
jgi:hypothetical protein